MNLQLSVAGGEIGFHQSLFLCVSPVPWRLWSIFNGFYGEFNTASLLWHGVCPASNLMWVLSPFGSVLRHLMNGLSGLLSALVPCPFGLAIFCLIWIFQARFMVANCSIGNFNRHGRMISVVCRASLIYHLCSPFISWHLRVFWLLIIGLMCVLL